MNDSIKPYKVRNMIINKLEVDNEIYEAEHPTGFLDVRVFDRISNEPINNAEVNIVEVIRSGIYGERGDGRLIIALRTNEYGRVPIIGLPAISPPTDNNTTESPNQPNYHMYVIAPNYYGAFTVNLQHQIYPNIKTVYNVNLNHVDSGVPRYEFIITPETREIHQMPHQVQ